MKYRLPSVKFGLAVRDQGAGGRGQREAVRGEQVPQAGRYSALSTQHSALSTHLSLLIICLLLAAAPLASAQSEPVSNSRSGQELIAQAAAQISESPSLEAKVRQRVALFGQVITGSGHYVQLRHGDGNHFRLDLRLPAGETHTSLQHHNDGVYLWIRRTADGEQQLSRVDLERVREARKKTPRARPETDSSSIGIGGLAQLLQGLSDSFSFGEARPDEIGGVPVWRISGTWKSSALALLLPDQADTIEAGTPVSLASLPHHVPDQVSLVLGRDTQVPLFPYRVEFSRQEAQSGRSRPTLTMELFEVRLRPDLDSRQFRFPLEVDQHVEDETDAYLLRHGLSTAE